MKKLIIILAIVLLPSIAFATFSIQFDNTTSKKMFYLLYWIDHTYDWQNKVMMNVNDRVKSVIVTPIKSSMKK